MIDNFKYLPISDVIKLLPHEEINISEVNEIVNKLMEKPIIKPIGYYKGVVMDGHHRLAALKILFNKKHKWKNKMIPMFTSNKFKVQGSSIKELLERAKNGKLMSYKTTYTTPRSPDRLMKIIDIK